MAIDPGLNFAVLPNGPYAPDVSRLLHDRGFEVLCHLPMEPLDGSLSAGAGAVTTSMSDDEIAVAVRANLERVPHARGMNNHMGSRATADRRVMNSVLSALPSGMYFIDSRTGDRSVATSVARSMKVKTAARHVFLDSVPSEAAIRRQMALLAEIAESRGVAIGIGHPRPATLRVLADEIPALRQRGFAFVRASEVVR